MAGKSETISWKISVEDNGGLGSLGSVLVCLCLGMGLVVLPHGSNAKNPCRFTDVLP